MTYTTAIRLRPAHTLRLDGARLYPCASCKRPSRRLADNRSETSLCSPACEQRLQDAAYDPEWLGDGGLCGCGRDAEDGELCAACRAEEKRRAQPCPLCGEDTGDLVDLCPDCDLCEIEEEL